MNDIARQLRAQIPASTDPDRLERMAREIEGAVLGVPSFALSQAFTQRPIPAHRGGYATVVPDLYLIGAASWPGVAGLTSRSPSSATNAAAPSSATGPESPSTRTFPGTPCSSFFATPRCWFNRC